MDSPAHIINAGTSLIVLFALVHASFQLGVSVLTLLSGHSLGRQSSLRRLLGLNIGYILGSLIMASLVLMAALYSMQFAKIEWLVFIWGGLALLACVLAMLVMLGYYRPGAGTMLWVPRSLAHYLSSRAKSTTHVTEAAILGATAVIAELPFTLVVFGGVSFVMLQTLGQTAHLLGVATYCIGINLPLIIITVLIAGGHRVSTIQRWRENNKLFLQYAAGAGLLAISLYILVFFIAPGEPA